MMMGAAFGCTAIAELEPSGPPCAAPAAARPIPRRTVLVRPTGHGGSPPRLLGHAVCMGTNLRRLSRLGPAQCDLRVGARRAVSEACMYAGTAGRLGSNIPKFNFAPLYVNTRW